MTTTADTKQVTVVGAGLAGSLLAALLAQRGHSVALYERRPDLRRTDLPAGRSINLALANRGIRGLEMAGVMDRVRPQLIPMRGRMLHDAEGRQVLVPYGSRPHEVIHSVSRTGLNEILLDAAEATGRVELCCGQNCRDVDFEASEIELRDEETGELRREPFEVLIGTDGSASKVRDAVMAATGGEFREEPLGHAYKELTFPPGPDGGFLIEPEALHIWPRGGYMLIALPNPDRTFTVTLFLPAEGEESFDALDSPEAVRNFFERRFADAVPLLPRLTEDFFANPTGSLATVRCRPWHHGGRALLLGDAAHAIVPFHGQGMNCAFEDCADLAEILDGGPAGWETVFETFATRRKPDADAIADMALENYVEMRDTVADERFQLMKQVGFELEERHPGRFRPRYSMVMFDHLPYAKAKRRGEVNRAILTELTEGVVSLDQIDWAHAARLVEDWLAPLGGD